MWQTIDSRNLVGSISGSGVSYGTKNLRNAGNFSVADIDPYLPYKLFENEDAVWYQDEREAGGDGTQFDPKAQTKDVIGKFLSLCTARLCDSAPWVLFVGALPFDELESDGLKSKLRGVLVVPPETVATNRGLKSRRNKQAGFDMEFEENVDDVKSSQGKFTQLPVDVVRYTSFDEMVEDWGNHIGDDCPEMKLLQTQNVMNKFRKRVQNTARQFAIAYFKGSNIKLSLSKHITQFKARTGKPRRRTGRGRTRAGTQEMETTRDTPEQEAVDGDMKQRGSAEDVNGDPRRSR